MKSLVIMSYVQPVEGNVLRMGVVTENRDTVKHPVGPSNYRLFDSAFRRSQHLLTCMTFGGFRKFYAERVNWKLTIPFVGSLVAPFMSKCK